MSYNVVLVRPEGAINIGLVARATKNFGANLVLVDPKVNHLQKEALTFAANAFDILENAKIYNDLPTALIDTPLSLGFSRRTGQFRRKDLSLDQLDNFIEYQGEKNIALVFGNEQTGLNDFELRCTTLCVSINTHPSQPSLNLSHAVAIVLQRLFQSDRSEDPTSLIEEIKNCSDEFMSFLDDIHYFKNNIRKKNFHSYLEKILTRGISEHTDALVIKKILTIIRGSVKRLRTK
ncbi:MAG: RNA methyltransferase [Brevinema sp.]